MEYLKHIIGSGATALKVVCTLDDNQVLSQEDAHVALFNEGGNLLHSSIMTEKECFTYVGTYGFIAVISAVEYLTFYNMYLDEKTVKPSPVAKAAETVVKPVPRSVIAGGAKPAVGGAASVGGGYSSGAKTPVVIPDDSDFVRKPPSGLVKRTDVHASDFFHPHATIAVRKPAEAKLGWTCVICDYGNLLKDDCCAICTFPK
jgi:hypothetical protein